jgi:acyl-CoA synthetase (AMP-forming)/AMP-acid ligase II
MTTPSTSSHRPDVSSGGQRLAGILREHFKVSPERVAITLQHAGQDDIPISYARLLGWASAYADVYARKGIKATEVVILILEHGEALVDSFYGAILGGQIPSIMPFLTEKLSPERYRADLASLISITKPAAIVTSPEFEPEIRQAVGEGSSVRAVILTSEVNYPLALDFDRLQGMTCQPESITLLQHSSGTTGLQKGVALSHIAILNQIEAYRESIRLNAEDVIVSWLPLYHDMGLIAGFLMPILTGVPLVLMSPFDWVRAPQRLFQAVSQYRGTLSWLPNFAYNFCAQKIRDRHMEGVDLSTWRAVINCSEPVRRESHELFYEKFKAYGLKFSALQTCYAMAENVFGVTQSDLATGAAVEEVDQQAFYRDHALCAPVAGQPSMRIMSSGKPLSNTEVKIIEPKSHHDLPERHIGEIALRSNSMLTEYYHRQDVTERAFRDGWYLTGDLGYLSNGELFVTGRKKDMIIVGGKNIYPQDIEALVNQIPGVHSGRAVTFGVFDENQGTEEVVVVAEVENESPERRKIIADEIRQHVAKNSAVVLRTVHLVGPKWLLKTSSGKIARSANREKFLAETK